MSAKNFITLQFVDKVGIEPTFIQYIRKWIAQSNNTYVYLSILSARQDSNLWTPKGGDLQSPDFAALLLTEN